MANAVIPKWQGDNYQSRVFWTNALNLLKPHTSVVEVTFEAERPKAFDDVVVKYDPPIVYSGKDRVTADYHQVKWHVDTGHRFGYEDLVDPRFINAKATSLLQRLRTAFESAGPSAVFTFMTVARIKDGDPLARLISSNDRSLLIERLFDGTTDRSDKGRLRKLWREHLGLATDDNLRPILSRFRVIDGYRTLQELRAQINERAIEVGLIAGADTESDFRYDELARQLKARGLNVLTRESLLVFCQSEGLVAERAPEDDGHLPVAIRSFIGPAADVVDAASEHTLSLTGEFRERYIREDRSWQHDIRPKIEQFLTDMVKLSPRLRLILDAHASIAFLSGAVLDFKSAVGIELVQKGRVGAQTWLPNDGSDEQGARLVENVQHLGNGREFAIGLGITQPVEAQSRAYIERELPNVGTMALFTRPAGPGQRSVLGGGHAAALAEQVSNWLRVAKTNNPDAIVHIFAACPNSLLFYLGQHHQGIAPVVIYEFDFDRQAHRTYQPSIQIE